MNDSMEEPVKEFLTELCGIYQKEFWMNSLKVSQKESQEESRDKSMGTLRKISSKILLENSEEMPKPLENFLKIQAKIN